MKQRKAIWGPTSHGGGSLRLLLSCWAHPKLLPIQSDPTQELRCILHRFLMEELYKGIALGVSYSLARSTNFYLNAFQRTSLYIERSVKHNNGRYSDILNCTRVCSNIFTQNENENNSSDRDHEISLETQVLPILRHQKHSPEGIAHKLPPLLLHGVLQWINFLQIRTWTYQQISW